MRRRSDRTFTLRPRSGWVPEHSDELGKSIEIFKRGDRQGDVIESRSYYKGHVDTWADGEGNALAFGIGDDGRIYLACEDNCIRIISPEGRHLLTWPLNNYGTRSERCPWRVAVSIRDGLRQDIWKEMQQVAEIAYFPPGIATISLAYLGKEHIHVINILSELTVFEADGTIALRKEIAQDDPYSMVIDNKGMIHLEEYLYKYQANRYFALDVDGTIIGHTLLYHKTQNSSTDRLLQCPPRFVCDKCEFGQNIGIRTTLGPQHRTPKSAAIYLHALGFWSNDGSCHGAFPNQCYREGMCVCRTETNIFIGAYMLNHPETDSEDEEYEPVLMVFDALADCTQRPRIYSLLLLHPSLSYNAEWYYPIEVVAIDGKIYVGIHGKIVRVKISELPTPDL